MNWSEIKTNWNEMRPLLQGHWPKLTHKVLDGIDGDRYELCRALQVDCRGCRNGDLRIRKGRAMAGRRQVTQACDFLISDFRHRAACAVADGSPFRAKPLNALCSPSSRSAWITS
jgi:hypothetical protein